MTLGLWMLLLMVAFCAVVALNARVRKQVLIVTTYISLTGWYYYRKWEKKSGGAPASKRKSRGSSSRKIDSDSDVRFFEPAEKVLQREQEEQQQDREDRVSQYSASESSYRLSETSSSGQSEEPTGKNGAPKTHSGIFRKLRKSQREVQSEGGRLSDASVASTMSTTTTSTSRRTFSGRKKPAAWGE